MTICEDRKMNTIPDYPEIMIAVLKICSDDSIYKRLDLMELVADYFSLSDEQKKIKSNNSKEPIYKNRISYVLTYFASDKYVPEQNAKLLLRVDTGLYKISSIGKKCLENKDLFIRWYTKYIEKHLGKLSDEFITCGHVHNEKLVGKIEFLNREKGFGYTLVKDIRYSIQKSHIDEKLWNSLAEGDEITFDKLEGKRGAFYAANIHKKRTLNDDNYLAVENVDRAITLNELVGNHGKFYLNWRNSVLDSIFNNIPAINDTTSPDDFEDLIFTILKLLGINEIYQFPRSNQAGKPDGIFRIGNLIVLYDCTLRKDFQSHKDWQIDNYTAKLKDSKIPITYRKDIDGQTDIKRKTFQLNNLTKHSWIITRGKTSEIDSIDDVCIKEVSLDSLLSILKNRLTKNYFNEDSLVKALIEIDDNII